MTSRRRLAFAAALVLTGAAALVFLPLSEWLTLLVQRSHALGPAGPYLFCALAIPAGILGLPGTPITLIAGYVYGFWPTWPAALVMSNLGAAGAFLTSRFLLARPVERWTATRPRLAALLRAIDERSFRLVVLLRLTPAVPFDMVNYALGVTPIRFARFMAATALGTLLGTTVNVYIAATLGALGQTLDSTALGSKAALDLTGKILIGTRIAVALVATVIIMRIARRALADAWRASESAD